MQVVGSNGGAWFYRGSSSPKGPVAHWIYHAGKGPLCGRLKPRSDGFAWRHPSHDRRIPKCSHCLTLLKKESANKPIVPPPK